MDEASSHVLVKIMYYSDCGGDSGNNSTWPYTNMPQTDREVICEFMAQEHGLCGGWVGVGERCKLMLLDCVCLEICHWHPFN